jgi:TolA-binding protein
MRPSSDSKYSGDLPPSQGGTPAPLPARAPTVCQICGGAPLSELSKLAVCEPCRQKLIRRPLPVWIKAAAAIICVLLVAAFVRFPAALRAGVNYERAQTHERSGQYTLAVAEFEEAARRYPDSTELKLHLAIAAYKAGDTMKSARVLDSLAGRQIPKSMASDARWLEQQFGNHMEKLPANPSR